MTRLKYALGGLGQAEMFAFEHEKSIIVAKLPKIAVKARKKTALSG